MQIVGFNMIRLDMSDLPTRHTYGLALTQNHIERILAEWVGDAGVPIYHGREVTGFAQNVLASTSHCPTASRCAQGICRVYGGRSVIRKAAGTISPDRIDKKLADRRG